MSTVERRRRWTADEKVSILDEAFRQGESVAGAGQVHKDYTAVSEKAFSVAVNPRPLATKSKLWKLRAPATTS